MVLMNITQDEMARVFFSRRAATYLPRLLPLITSKHSARRSGIAGLLKNLCFAQELHETLMEYDVGTYLLLPLVSAADQYRAEEREAMPGEWLMANTEGKARESSVEVRRQVLDAVFMLADSSPGKTWLRNKHAFAVIRCAFDAEKNAAIRTTCISITQRLYNEQIAMEMTNAAASGQIAMEDADSGLMLNQSAGSVDISAATRKYTGPMMYPKEEVVQEEGEAAEMGELF
eukprot:TRINITY_DN1277_c0_g1_i1.p1 TRINITY_DN1277_c0_g1~~TRINITY_DN1277_c0_g1_i1.p1  ORF type:complete len:231 (-),score=63.63 TRINITY_DN1277_c0_g1_i1:139-831(-)